MNDISVYESDYHFDTGNVNGLATIRQNLPEVVTRDSTIVVEGRPQFKSAPVIHCPRCQQALRAGQTTIHFKNAPAERRDQTVEGFVCECGESYVPGETAQLAFQSAFSDQPPLGPKKSVAASKKPRVFVSYSYAASHYGNLLKVALEKGGFETVDYHQPDGQFMTDAIIKRVRSCDYFVGIWHHEEDTGISPWLPFEYGVARTLKKQCLIVHSEKLDTKIAVAIEPGTAHAQYSDLNFASDTIETVVTRISTASHAAADN